MTLDEIRPGLWRWTARHPDAEEDPEPESPADWPPHVGCVAYAAPTAFVFVDPLLAEDGEVSWMSNGMTLSELRRSLGQLLDLPVELVLVSHGDPVLQGGRAALAQALGTS